MYLENYNPNLEHKSLIKRFGERLETYKDRPIFFYVGNYSQNVFNYPENREISFAHDILLTSNPDYNKSYISFIKRLPKLTAEPGERDNLFNDNLINLEPECTAVVARVIENDGTDDIVTWTEPFHAEAKYPGWYTVGFYTDHVRYGEQLLFTTALENKEYGTDLDRYLFPVYQWGLWDITKKRKDENDWWNGIDFSDLKTNKKDYRKWKVKTPTMDFLRGDVVGYTWWDKDTDTWERKRDEKPIEIMFMENDLDYAEVEWAKDFFFGPFDRGRGVPGSNGTSIDTIVNERKSYLSKSAIDNFPKLNRNRTYNNESLFFHSYEIYDNKIYEEEITNRGYALSYVQFANWESKELFNGSPHDYHFPIATEYIIPKAIKIAYSDTYILREDQDDGSDDNLEYHFMRPSPRHLYLRYIDNNVPRPWHKKEKIPFVLTVKIGGVETVLYKDVYEIQSQQGIEGPEISYYEFLTEEGNPGTDSYRDGFVMTPPSTLDVDVNIDGDIGDGSPLIKSLTSNVAIRSADTASFSPHVRIEEIGDFGNIGDKKAKLTINNMLQFSIKINKEYFGKLIEQEAVEFNFYVSEKHETKKHLSTIGIIAPVEIPPGYYSKPAVEDVNINDIDFDFAKFRLVKSFLINGNSQEIDYESYIGTATKTNAWVTGSDDGDTNSDDYIYAVPNVTDGTGFIERDKLPLFDNTFAKRGVPYGGGINNNDMWYSDFTLWDYPADAPPLTLNNSGRYWKGLAANHIETIRGRTFIAGCIDENGKEEQAVIRYSVIQNGVHLKDVFVEEDEITFGHSPITALLNYRDQLWVFNRDNQYRLAPHNIYDPNSWEVLDVQHAQGTLSNKTIAITPNGVCFASKNGIWISDGRMPISLTDNPERGLAIQSLYQRLTLGKVYDYQSQIDPGRPYINPDNDFNPYLELHYSKKNNELILSTPVKRQSDEMYEDLPNNYIIDDWEYLNHELKLIYSFSNNNWRTEVFNTSTEGITSAGSSRYKDYSKSGKFHISNEFESVVKEVYGVPNNGAIGRNSNYPNAGITFNETDSDLDYDLVSFLEFLNVTEQNYTDYEKAIPIIGKIVTHEIGDGENDFVLRKAYLECSPRDISDFDKSVYGYKDYLYENSKPDYTANTVPSQNEDIDNGYKIGDIWCFQNSDIYYVCINNTSGNAIWQNTSPIRDPYFLYELRSRDWQNQVDRFDFNDIIKINMRAKKGKNPFLSFMQTPGGTNYGPSDKVVAHESIVALYPRQTKFRRARFRLVSEIVVKIRGIVNEYSMFKRRSK